MNNIEIIETNISFKYIEKAHDFYIKIEDHQSRVIKSPNWSTYVDHYLIPNNKEVRKFFPRTLPRFVKITHLKHDDFHLSCIIDNGKFLTYRLAYIKGEIFKKRRI